MNKSFEISTETSKKVEIDQFNIDNPFFVNKETVKN